MNAERGEATNAETRVAVQEAAKAKARWRTLRMFEKNSVFLEF